MDEETRAEYLAARPAARAAFDVEMEAAYGSRSTPAPEGPSTVAVLVIAGALITGLWMLRTKKVA